MNTIKSRWETFEREILPIDAPAIMRSQTRQSFYAGALSIMLIQRRLPKDVEAAVAILAGLENEMEAFCLAIEEVAP